MVGDVHTAKSGDAGVVEQGLYAHQLGVGPEILQITDTGYLMRTASAARVQEDPMVAFWRALRLLRDRVWTREVEGHEWFPSFRHWAAHQVYDPMRAIASIYVPSRIWEYRQCLIHGDPTLSNMMYPLSGEDRLLIADPIRAEGKIPGYPEVDAGKLLQSLIGWEHVAYGWEAPRRAYARLFLEFLHIEVGIQPQAALFWLGVHALRIIPYAQRAGNTYIERWSLDVGQYVFNHLHREDPCDTLMTLMGRSQTHATQFYSPIGWRE